MEVVVTDRFHSIHKAAQKIPFKMAKQARQSYESRHDFNAVYISQFAHYVSLLSASLLTRLFICVFIIICSIMMCDS